MKIHDLRLQAIVEGESMSLLEAIPHVERLIAEKDPPVVQQDRDNEDLWEFSSPFIEDLSFGGFSSRQDAVMAATAAFLEASVMKVSCSMIVGTFTDEKKS